MFDLALIQPSHPQIRQNGQYRGKNPCKHCQAGSASVAFLDFSVGRLHIDLNAERSDDFVRILFAVHGIAGSKNMPSGVVNNIPGIADISGQGILQVRKHLRLNDRARAGKILRTGIGSVHQIHRYAFGAALRSIEIPQCLQLLHLTEFILQCGVRLRMHIIRCVNRRKIRILQYIGHGFIYGIHTQNRSVYRCLQGVFAVASLKHPCIAYDLQKNKQHP